MLKQAATFNNVVSKLIMIMRPHLTSSNIRHKIVTSTVDKVVVRFGLCTLLFCSIVSVLMFVLYKKFFTTKRQPKTGQAISVYYT